VRIQFEDRQGVWAEITFGPPLNTSLTENR
jgi:hypothetical protein